MTEENKEKTVVIEHSAHKWPWLFGGFILLIVLIGVAAGHLAYHRMDAGFAARKPEVAFYQMHGRKGRIAESKMAVAGELVGGVAAANGNVLTVRVSGTNQSVDLSSSTSFYKNGVIAKQTDLQVGDIVTVVGNPNSSGIIQASSVGIR